jgi:Replication-relaxation
MLQLRDLDVLASVARYYTLTRSQINRLHFPADFDGRITRRRLMLLHDEGMINRTHMQVANPSMGAPAYVYYPSAKGCAFLAQELRDDRYKSVCTLTPHWTYLYHWVAVAQTHILLDQAVARLNGVKLDRWLAEAPPPGGVNVEDWLSEWSIANPDEKEPDKRFRLYTKLGPKLVCAPDAGFLLAKDGFRKAFYLEQDRDTTRSAERVAAQKCHGYAGLFERRLHIARHFPTTNVERFAVLFVAPSVNRRDALRKAFATRPAAWLYKFCAQTELSCETFLTAPIWHPCMGDPGALVKNGGAA